MLEKLSQVRTLSAEEMGVSKAANNMPLGEDELLMDPEDIDLEHVEEDSQLEDDHPILIKVQELLSDGFSGVIFTGPPGTGKSRFARLIASKLCDADAARIFFSQFHPSYQYEDFVEAYVPNKNGGFDLKEKIFLSACTVAENTQKTVVLVIDELSRTDVVRVFGEVLTYLEKTKRGMKFTLSSGKEISIPRNLILLATMNPWDRGVDELDLALERRFAKISVSPSLEALRQILAGSTLDDIKKGKLEQFFQMISNSHNHLCRIGHAYFLTAKSEPALRRLWENQLSFHFQRVLAMDNEELTSINAAWDRIFQD